MIIEHMNRANVYHAQDHATEMSIHILNYSTHQPCLQEHHHHSTKELQSAGCNTSREQEHRLVLSVHQIQFGIQGVHFTPNDNRLHEVRK